MQPQAQQALGTPGTQLHGPLPRAEPGVFLETAQQMEARQAHFSSHLLQARGLLQVSRQQLLQALHGGMSQPPLSTQAHAGSRGDPSKQQGHALFATPA